MQLQHEKAAVLSDRDKGIARACQDLGINERKCAVHIHANFHQAGYFIGPKKETRGPFVEFVKAPHIERSEYLKLQLRTHHVHPEKWSAFLKAHGEVERWVSVLSAIEQGPHSRHLLFSFIPVNALLWCCALSRRFGCPWQSDKQQR